MRRTEKEAKITREHLLDAALVVFCQRGYGETRLEDIASFAGVTRGAVYHHFGGKPEIYSALLNERYSYITHALEATLRQGGTPLEVLQRFLTRAIEYLEEDVEYHSIQDLVLFKTGYSLELKEALAQKTKSQQYLMVFITGLIRRAVESGEIRTDIDPRDTALAAIGLVNGVSLLWLFDPDSFSLQERAGRVVDTFIHGLLP